MYTAMAAPCRSFLRMLAAAVFLSALHTAAGSSGDDVLLNMESMFPGPSCLPTKARNHDASKSTRMNLVHQYGPCSPVAEAQPSQEEVLAADQKRVDSIQQRANNPVQPGALGLLSPSSTSLPASSGHSLGTGNYVVTIGLGTPAGHYTVAFDTGSDTTWVQCRPCVDVCYKQKEPLFNPARSITYANISCADSACTDLLNHGCNAGNCIYAVQYGDGSLSVGFFAQETLTLSPIDAIQGFHFGCGQRNSGTFGKIAGLLGLGRGNSSLTVQAYQKYGGVFTYCLPASTSGTGYLDLGPGSPPPANAIVTPMLIDRGPEFYYMALAGIRVDGQQLAIPESVFSTAGTVVDSGTVITQLPDTAYAALRSAFADAMSARGYKKVPSPFTIFDTCYDFRGLTSVPLPTVSLVFQGDATLDVDSTGIMFTASRSAVCLAFTSNGDDTRLGVIGNMVQKTYGVRYDLGNRVISFAPRAC